MNTNKTIRVAFFDAKEFDRTFFNRANAEYNFSIDYFEGRLTPQTASLSEKYDTVCVFVNDQVDADVADILNRNGISLIALRSAGYNNVDLESVSEKIHVVRVPEYSPHAVAEHAAALMLALNRRIHRAYNRTRDMNFNINGLLGFDMNSRTAGVIGTGKIGKALIQILCGMGMNVLGYDIKQDRDFEQKAGFSYTGLDSIYRESDIISLNCPLTKETYHMIDAQSIKKMKDKVMIINTGRGRLIDTKALIRGLKERKVGSAGLDVYEEESEYFYEDFSAEIISDDTLARLISFNNVLVTSHQGFFTRDALEKIADITLENIRLFFEEDRMPNEICYKCSG